MPTIWRSWRHLRTHYTTGVTPQNTSPRPKYPPRLVTRDRVSPPLRAPASDRCNAPQRTCRQLRGHLLHFAQKGISIFFGKYVERRDRQELRGPIPVWGSLGFRETPSTTVTIRRLPQTLWGDLHPRLLIRELISTLSDPSGPAIAHSVQAGSHHPATPLYPPTVSPPPQNTQTAYRSWLVARSSRRLHKKCESPFK